MRTSSTDQIHTSCPLISMIPLIMRSCGPVIGFCHHADAPVEISFHLTQCARPVMMPKLLSAMKVASQVLS